MTEYNGMHLDDIITTYHKGYFRLVNIIERGTATPLFEYLQVANSKGNLKNGKKIIQCDAAYCKPAIETLNELEETVSRIKSILT